MTDKVKITYCADIKVDIEEMAYSMSQGEAEQAIVAIDNIVCDLDFTLRLAKRFFDLVKAEGVEDYTNELREYVK